MKDFMIHAVLVAVILVASILAFDCFMCGGSFPYLGAGFTCVALVSLYVLLNDTGMI